MGEGIHNKKQSHYNPKNDTEGGMSRDLRTRVLDWENKHADDKYESVAVFDSKGKLVHEAKGEESSVSVEGVDLKDKIVTHNHPGHDVKGYTSSDSISRRIGGYPLSPLDIASAIDSNCKGVRARTDGYIFSLTRRGKDWGGLDPGQAAKELNSAIWGGKPNGGKGNLTAQQSNDRYIRNHLAATHRALKDFAKKYGFVYTRRKAR